MLRNVATGLKGYSGIGGKRGRKAGFSSQKPTPNRDAGARLSGKLFGRKDPEAVCSDRGCTAGAAGEHRHGHRRDARGDHHPAVAQPATLITIGVIFAAMLVLEFLFIEREPIAEACRHLPDVAAAWRTSREISSSSGSADPFCGVKFSFSM